MQTDLYLVGQQKGTSSPAYRELSVAYEFLIATIKSFEVAGYNTFDASGPLF